MNRLSIITTLICLAFFTNAQPYTKNNISKIVAIDGYRNYLKIWSADGKKGIMEKSGKVIVPPLFEEVLGTVLVEGLAQVKMNGKWGYADSTGRVVIPCIYDVVNSFYQGVTHVETDKFSFIIDKTGKALIANLPKTHSNSDGKGYYIRCLGEGIILTFSYTRTNRKDCKYFNLKGEQILKDFPYDLGVFQDGLAATQKGYYYGYFNTKGEEITDADLQNASPFLNGLGQIKMNGKQGYINKQGKIVIPCIFDYIDGWAFDKPLAIGHKDKKTAAYDRNGKEVIPLADGYISQLDNFIVQTYTAENVYKIYTPEGKILIDSVTNVNYNNEDRLLLIKKFDTWYYINIFGKPAFKGTYDDANLFKGGIAIVKKNDKYGVINEQGKIVIPIEYDNLEIDGRNFFGKHCIIAKKEEKYGVFDENQTLTIPFEYDYIRAGRHWQYIVSKGDKMGVVDEKNSTIFPLEDWRIEDWGEDAYLFNQNKKQGIYTWKKDEIYPIEYEISKPSNEFSNIKKENKKGYLNLDFSRNIPCEYDELFNENQYGFWVKKEGKYGYVSVQNEVILPIECDTIFRNQAIGNFYQVEKKGKKGVLYNGKLIVPIEYDKIESSELCYWLKCSSADKVVYFSTDKQQNIIFDKIEAFKDELLHREKKVKHNGKWGVIECPNKIKIPIEWDEINYSEYGFYTLRKGDKLAIADCCERGKVSDVIFNKFTSSNKVVAAKKEKWGYYNYQTNKDLSQYIYDSLLYYSVPAIAKKGNGWGLINEKGEEITSFDYEELIYDYPLIKFRRGDKYGILDKLGKVIIPPNYDNLEKRFESIWIHKGQNDTYTFFSSQGKPFIQGQFARVDFLYKSDYAKFIITYNNQDKMRFWTSEGMPISNKNVFRYTDYDNMLLLDTSDGQLIFDYKTRQLKKVDYEIVSISTYSDSPYKNYKIIKKNNKFGLLDTEDKEVFPAIYDYISFISREREKKVTLSKNGKVCLLDDNLKTIIPYRFEDIGMKIDDYTYEVKHKNQWLHYNTLTQKIIYPNAAEIERFGAFEAKPEQGYNGLLCITFDDLWGFMTMDRQIIQFPYYQSVKDFGKAHFLLAVKNNDKWGVYNLKTKQEVISTIYDEVDASAATGFVLLKKENKWSYADENGNLMADFTNDSKDFFTKIKEKNKENAAHQVPPIANTATKNISFGNYGAKYFSEGLIPFKYGATYGFSNLKGDFIIEPKYDDVHTFKNGLAVVFNNKKSAVINKKGEIVIPFKYDGIEDFSEGLAVTWHNRKYGIINEMGKEILPPIASYIKPFQEGLAAFRHPKTEKWGFLDKNGKEAIAAQFDNAYSFSEGLAEVYSNDKAGFIDKMGKLVIDFLYKKSNHIAPLWQGFTNGKMVVTTKNDYEIILDKQGKILVDETRKYKKITRFDTGFAYAEKDYTTGDWIDTLGNIIGKPNGFDIGEYGIFQNFNITNNDDRKSILSKFQLHFNLKNGFAQAKLNNHWGFIDREGNPITPFIYDKTSDFDENGIAAVQIGNYGYLINNKGECVLNCLEKPLIVEKKTFHAYFSDDLNSKIMYLVPFRKDKKWGYMMRETKEIIVPAIMDSCAFAKNNELLFVEKGKKYTIDFYNGFSSEAEGYETIYNPKYNSITHQKQNAKKIEDALPMIVAMEEKVATLPEPPPPMRLAPEHGKMVGFTYYNGTICVEKNGKFGIVNIKNEVIVPHKYDKFLGIYVAKLYNMFIEEREPKEFKYYLFFLKGELFYVDENGVEYRP